MVVGVELLDGAHSLDVDLGLAVQLLQAQEVGVCDEQFL